MPSLSPRYFWVNQNQTFAHEYRGGYLWSPKRKRSPYNKEGARNVFYDTMRIVRPGDIIFSYAGSAIVAVATVQSYCYEAPKPTEFADRRERWDNVGWRVDVAYMRLEVPLDPKRYLSQIVPLLPPKNSPYLPQGRGFQGAYLAKISPDLGLLLGNLIGTPALMAIQGSMRNDTLVKAKIPTKDKQEWERLLESEVEEDIDIPVTEKQAIIQARRGQGLFRDRVSRIEHACRITKVENETHLRASHIKPWRHSNNEERLEGENGLLLTPSVDHLFDRGFISFEDAGNLIVSPAADAESLERMGVPARHPFNSGGFSSGQRQFLQYHRDFILLSAAKG